MTPKFLQMVMICKSIKLITLSNVKPIRSILKPKVHYAKITHKKVFVLMVKSASLLMGLMN